MNLGWWTAGPSAWPQTPPAGAVSIPALWCPQRKPVPTGEDPPCWLSPSEPQGVQPPLCPCPGGPLPAHTPGPRALTPAQVWQLLFEKQGEQRQTEIGPEAECAPGTARGHCQGQGGAGLWLCL